MDVDKQYKIKIQQQRENINGTIKYIYRVTIDDVILTEVENLNPKSYSGVDGSFSNTWAPAQGYYRSLDFKPSDPNTALAPDASSDGDFEFEKLESGNLIFEDVTMTPNYEISVELAMTGTNAETWTNVFAFQKMIPTAVHSTHGGRIPAVFLPPGSRKLHICQSIGSNHNTCFNQPEEMVLGQWYTLIIKQYAIPGNQVRDQGQPAG